MASSSGKKYGLITHQPKKAPVLLPKLAAFGDSSDEEESAHSAVNQSLQFEAQKQKVKKQTQLEIQRALEEDPTVYEYDSIYDSMEQQKLQKAKALKATKDNKAKLLAGSNRASWHLDKIEFLMKILLISHDKYMEAKSNSRVGTFYAEMGGMIGHSGIKVENLLKNLGREYRDMVWQTEENEAQGLPVPPRLRGSQKLFSLFEEFAQMYGIMKERRHRPSQPSQGAADVANRLNTVGIDPDIQGEVTEHVGSIQHTPLEETMSGSTTNSPYPVRVQREDFAEEQLPLQNNDAVCINSASPPATSSTTADSHPFQASRRKKRKLQSDRLPIYPGFMRQQGRQRTFSKYSSGWTSARNRGKQKSREGKGESPTCQSGKRACSCQGKTSRFEEQLLNVLSGIGQELQLLRRGFFTVYNIGEEQNQNEDEIEHSSGEDLGSITDDNEERCNNALPSVVFPGNE
ncbi:uncharacterized protein LOC110990040 isoform X2 [Acanthaster planci]|uniref:Uncharacterized protein LOC110990040 isoform X2 n=1 Tax=Acanthaster planci TaxID=133434 RepID=A0A8B7ZZI5_ACAPL|nr:uncharacterized protein LOC110990040 isoform X2 [Acanthaster planci]